MANYVSFFEIISKDSKKIGEFYSKVFGWNILPPAGSMEYRLMIADKEKGINGAVGDPYANDESWMTIYVSVDNIDEIIASVVENGGEVKIPKFTTDTGFTVAYVKDCNGNILGITENQV